MNNFCAYLHKRPDGTPFYVGKGTKRRALLLVRKDQNLHHHHVVEKYGKENILIEIMAENLTEVAAFQIEMEVIAGLKAIGCELTNLTNGG